MKLSIEATPGLQFEPKRLRVPPGARVALTFQNADPSMPHNVAIVKADQMEAFGEASMMLASNPRAIATHYVPDDPAEICFSPILNPNERYTVFFEAPKEQGEYRMICTYPGHWRVMRGSLFVLPEDQPLPASAESDVRKFVKQWTVDDLSADASALRGRNFERGKAIFAQAGCIKCHRMGAEGEKLGPELTNIVERFQGLKLLQQVLDPSTEINKQYQTWVAVTNEGRTVTGLMVEQTDQTISLLPNPLKPETKVELRKADLEELFASPQSTMPAGLLMVYERSEILDLLAYLTAGGKPEHTVFGK